MKNNLCPREVVVAQLAERSPTIPEDPGSNPVIGNFYLNIYLLLTVCRKDENKEKEAENGPFFKKNCWKNITYLPTREDSSDSFSFIFVIFADDWILTADFWNWKRPVC